MNALNFVSIDQKKTHLFLCERQRERERAFLSITSTVTRYNSQYTYLFDEDEVVCFSWTGYMRVRSMVIGVCFLLSCCGSSILVKHQCPLLVVADEWLWRRDPIGVYRAIAVYSIHRVVGDPINPYPVQRFMQNNQWWGVMTISSICCEEGKGEDNSVQGRCV